MAVAVLNPQDNLKQPLSAMKYPRNPTSFPNRHNKTRRYPPRNQITRSPPPISPQLPPPRSSVSSPSPAKKKIQIRILKRGEEIPKETLDLLMKKSDLRPTRWIKSDPIMKKSNLRSARRIRSDPIMIHDQIPKETVDLVIEKSDLRSTRRIKSDRIMKKSNLRSTRRIRSDPILIPDQNPKETVDLVIEKSDLRSTRRIRSDPIMIRKSKTVTYAGPVTLTSPPPSEVPLPAFFAATKKRVSLFESDDATNDLIRILRLDIA